MTIVRMRAALLAIAALLVPAGALGAPVPLTILHVNDTHSHLDAIGPKDRHLDGTRGGLAKAATVITTLKATQPNALFVHAGDLFNGDAYFAAGIGPGGVPLLAVPELQLLRQVGLDVLAVGNHDLGLGTDRLAAVLQAAAPGQHPSVLTANVDLAAAGLEGIVQRRVVKEIGGLRVGFFGMTAIDFLSRNAPFEARDLDGILAIATREAAALRASADVVIFLSHLGFALDQAIAAHVPGIDAIVGGHDHLLLSAPVMVAGPGGKPVPVVSAGDFYQWVGELTLLVEGGEVILGGYRLVPVDAGVPRLPPVAAAVNSLKAAIDQRQGEDLWHAPIAWAILDVAKEPPEGSPLRDSPIGDLVTDALRHRGRTDMALTVHGFFTEGLTRGRLVGDDAFRVVSDGIDPGGGGLGFPLYEVKLEGRSLLAALETSLALGGDFVLHTSGMTYVYDSRRPAGSRLRGAFVGGMPVDPARVYSATINVGAVQGLTQFPGVTLVEPPRPIGSSEYEAVRDWLMRRSLVLYFSHGRIIDVAGMR